MLMEEKTDVSKHVGIFHIYQRAYKKYIEKVKSAIHCVVAYMFLCHTFRQIIFLPFNQETVFLKN